MHFIWSSLQQSTGTNLDLPFPGRSSFNYSSDIPLPSPHWYPIPLSHCSSREGNHYGVIIPMPTKGEEWQSIEPNTLFCSRGSPRWDLDCAFEVSESRRSTLAWYLKKSNLFLMYKAANEKIFITSITEYQICS